MADNESRLESILCRFDADWTAGDEARTEAKNDLFFSRVSQWDDWLTAGNGYAQSSILDFN